MEWGRIALGVGTIVVFALLWFRQFGRRGGINDPRWRSNVAALASFVAIGTGIWVAWITDADAGLVAFWLWLTTIGALGAMAFTLWIERGKPWS